jgi:hypothetical protein
MNLATLCNHTHSPFYDSGGSLAQFAATTALEAFASTGPRDAPTRAADSALSGVLEVAGDVYSRMQAFFGGHGEGACMRACGSINIFALVLLVFNSSNNAILAHFCVCFVGV